MRILWESCQECNLASLDRIPRRFWMRLLPGLRHYHCRQCGADVLAPKKAVESHRWAAISAPGQPLPPATQPRQK